ncbi:MAG: copper resistance protein CopC [Gemmatimonadota bacterium]|nr:copper resistance protein CopC [Gemmatimonadota bacterium]
MIGTDGRTDRKTVRRWILGAALLVAGVTLALGAQPAAAAILRHLQLASSYPAADARLARAPAEVRVVFSEQPGPGTSLRLTRGETLVETTDVAADSADAKQFFIRPARPLADGAYTAHWRAVAADGHPSTGTFNFQVGGAD